MNFSSPRVKPDVTLSLTLSSPTSTTTTDVSTTALKPEERGVKLIQLLLTCANHASSGNLHHADSCLSKILQLSSVTGDSMQRLAAWFASSLAVRLVKRWPGLYKALNHREQVPSSTIVDLDRSRIIFAKAFPYMGFAYAVINRILIQAMSEDRIIHIVDLGCGDPKLWVPFLKNLVTLPNGPPYLRITCVSNNKAMLEDMEIRIKKEAEALDIPFQFNHVSVSLKELTLDMIEVKPGESLAFVSVLNLHVLLAEDDHINSHFGLNKKNNNNVKDCKRMSEFLAMLHSLSPKVLILVEQEADHNLNKLVDRFVEGLHYYSALFDSIDTTFGGSNSLCEERVAVEQMFGKEIENMVACEGLEREERHERFGQWLVRLTRGGFRPVRLWYDIMEDAKKLVEAYGEDGYKVISQRGSLMICWHDRPIYSVSAWNCFN